MGNIDSNSTEINVENLNISKNSNTLQIVVDDPKMDKISIKKAKQKMTYKSKHNEDLLDSDLIENAFLAHYYLGILSKQARKLWSRCLNIVFMKMKMLLSKEITLLIYIY